MSDVISYAKEVYYRFRDDQGTAKVVPIRGMYVTGEYKPPLYTNPIIHMLSLTTAHPLIEDYIETKRTASTKASHHLYDVSLNPTFRIDYYTTAKAPNAYAKASHHLYDVDIDPTYRVDYYTTINKSSNAKGSHHLYDVSINPSYSFSTKYTDEKSSQPEPIIRLALLSATSPIITNET